MMTAGTEEVQFEIRGFEPNDVRAESIRADLESAGGTAEVKSETGGDGRPIVFIPLILGAMALVALIGQVKVLLDDFQDGVIIDTRDGKVVTIIDKNLPKGTVVIIAADKTTVTLEQPDKVTLADAVKAAKDAIVKS